MIGKSKSLNNYVGPKAIFDQNYIPPEILYREKEKLNLFSILNDSFSDEFSINILYQGIKGIGKKVIINKVIQDLLKQDKLAIDFHNIVIDCKEKNANEIMFSILNEISNFHNLNLDFSSILKYNLSDLWNLFKLACKKANYNLIIILNNIEHLKPEFLKKILQYGKESNIKLISTVNKVLKPSTVDLLSYFDFKKRLNYFSYKELFDILKQRVSLAFVKELDKELIEFITDLIFEHYVPVPGKGVDVLRELYPVLSHQKVVNNYDILEIIQNQFDTIQISDEFALLNYISEEDILTLIFLDNLSNFFLNSSNYYINSKELKELYYVSCESIEYEKTMNVFHDLLNALQNVGILNYSKKNCNKLIDISPINHEFYFLVVNPNQLKAIVDAIFNKI